MEVWWDDDGFYVDPADKENDEQWWGETVD